MKPVIVGVDHNEATLQALRLDMVKRYGADYDVLVVRSGREASELFGTLAAEARPVALVIAYQWMDEATGIEVLKRSRDDHAGAMRVLMIDVGDLSAEAPIVKALTLNHIDYYFGKPWASPEEELYPVTGKALRVWARSHFPRYERSDSLVT
jgi:DNA-binding NtrC family response regulator